MSPAEFASFMQKISDESSLKEKEELEPSLIQILLKHVDDEEKKYHFRALPTIPNPSELCFDFDFQSPISKCFVDGKMEHKAHLEVLLTYIRKQKASYHNSKLLLRNIKELYNETQILKDALAFIDGF